MCTLRFEIWVMWRTFVVIMKYSDDLFMCVLRFHCLCFDYFGSLKSLNYQYLFGPYCCKLFASYGCHRVCIGFGKLLLFIGEYQIGYFLLSIIESFIFHRNSIWQSKSDVSRKFLVILQPNFSEVRLHSVIKWNEFALSPHSICCTIMIKCWW